MPTPSGDPAQPPARPSAGRNLVLYDGVCGLCDRAVQFLLEKDRAGAFHYAALQGETAAAVRRRHPRLEGVDSVVLVRDHGTPDEKVFLRSGAALEIAAVLSGFRRVVSWLRLVPRPLRDFVYDQVARRRYGWFGKLDSCKLPLPAVRARFLP